MKEKNNYYKILGLKLNASQEEIKRRFRELAKQFHPDKYFHPSQKIWATKHFQKLMEAYATLSNPQMKREYDESLTLKAIAVEEILEQKIPKDFYYFWWLRTYVYFLPLVFSFIMKLYTESVVSQRCVEKTM